MFIRQFTNKALDGREIKGFQIVENTDRMPEGIELIELTVESQIVEYANVLYCGCPKRHRGWSEGVVQIYVDSHGRLHIDWSGVEDSEFPCESDA